MAAATNEDPKMKLVAQHPNLWGGRLHCFLSFIHEVDPLDQ
ncbi:hypothetical protein [Azospirillum oleiclasticum]|nr:hypothetical protein [Azospirillum oleiclasticum]